MNSKSVKFNQYICMFSVAVIAFSAQAKPEQVYKPYKSAQVVENIQPRLFIINDVKVTLVSKIDAPDFLTQDQIKERYIKKLTEELKINNLLANEKTEKPILVKFDIKQKRVFAGEDLKFLSSKVVGKYAQSTMQYTSSLNNGAVELAKFKSDERVSIGKKGSIGKIMRDLSGKGNPENELEDIDGFAKYMIEQLPQ